LFERVQHLKAIADCEKLLDLLRSFGAAIRQVQAHFSETRQHKLEDNLDTRDLQKFNTALKRRNRIEEIEHELHGQPKQRLFKKEGKTPPLASGEMDGVPAGSAKEFSKPARYQFDLSLVDPTP
jgi:Sec-independent protein translocase protein TatA